MPEPLPAILKTRDADRMRRYAEHLRFYNGDQVDPGRNVLRLRRGERRPLTLNLTQAIIDKSANYLVQDMRAVADPIDDTQPALDAADTVETALQQVAEQNQLDALDFENEVDCSVLGDAAYKVTWDPAESRVRVTTPDVTGIHVWRRPDDPNEIWRVAQLYKVDADTAARLYQISSRNADAEIIEEWTHDRFVLWADGVAVREERNPYPFIPYIIYANIRRPKKLWGDSDITPIVDAQREYNRVSSQLATIAELSGNPITVLENVSESSDIGIQPGAVWELPPDAKAYVLDLLARGGVKILLDLRDRFRADMHDLSEVPPTAFGHNERALSGVALNVALDPLVKKVRRKRITRGRALATRNGMILRLLADNNQIADQLGAHPTRIQWGNLLPNDRSRDVADEVALVNALVHSRRRAAINLGIDDPDAEFDRAIAEAGQLVEVQPTQTPTPQRTTNL